MVMRCIYSGFRAFPVTWIINGTSFDQSALENSPLYLLNNPGSPSRVSLTVFSINHTTTFQCVVHYTASKIGTVTVTTGTYMCIITYMYICNTYVYNCMDVRL